MQELAARQVNITDSLRRKRSSINGNNLRSRAVSITSAFLWATAESHR
jgi:hypothetical protein